MAEAVAANPLLNLLVDLECRSQTEAKGLPTWQDSSLYWEGFVFQVANMSLLASMEEVVEIINQVPVLTRVPGAKPWVRGVVNFRGNLLPLMDLQQLMNGLPLAVGRQARILVVDQGGTLTGLLVASVGGRKRFPRSDFTRLEETPAAVAIFVEGGFLADGTEWPVFSLTRLLAYPDYQIAAR